MSIDAMKQALEALESDHDAMVDRGDGHWDFKRDLAITALRAAIEKAERPWQGLTDEDILLAFCYVEYETSNNWVKNPRAWCISNARYLEKILRKKNT